MSNVKIVKRFDKVKKAVDTSVLETFGDAARLTRAIARRSIRERSGTNYARPGQPPKTRFGGLKKSILYDLDKKREEAIIGPAFSRMGEAAAAHEKGGMFRGRRYDARPYMWPAFEKIIPRLPRIWRY